CDDHRLRPYQQLRRRFPGGRSRFQARRLCQSSLGTLLPLPGCSAKKEIAGIVSAPEAPVTEGFCCFIPSLASFPRTSDLAPLLLPNFFAGWPGLSSDPQI